MNHSLLNSIRHGSRRAPATGCRLMLTLVAAMGLGVIGATPAHAGRYSASISPTTVAVTVSRSYTLTINNEPSISTNDPLGSSYNTLPSGFTSVTVGTPTASASKVWTATVSGGQVQLVASSDANRLSEGQSVSVAVTMTAPSTSGSRAWDSDAYAARAHTGSAFTRDGSEPAILVTGSVNTAPTAVADTGYSTAEDTPLSGTTVLANDSDPQSNTLTAVLVSGPTHSASFTLNANGTFAYTPAANYYGPDSFTYKANDGSLDSNTVSVSITVSSVPDVPVAVNDLSYSTNEDVPLTGTSVLANDSDGDGDTITAVLDSTVNDGNLVLNANGTFTYTPNLNFHGTDSFTYHANDGTSNSTTVTATITVNSVNDVPVSNNDTGYGTDEDVVLNGNSVLGNDSDPDSEPSPLTAVLVADVANGTLVLDPDGTFDYTPDANYHGPDSFTYHAYDGANYGNTVTVSITVASFADAPIAVADTAYGTDEDVPLNGTSVLANDSDGDGDSITAVLDTTVGHGTLVLAADGTFTYTPSANYHGTDSFTYHAYDGALSSGVVTATITVTSIEDVPVAVNDTVSTDEDVILNGNSVLANDSDGDSDALTAVLDADVTNGTLSLDPDGTFNYTPDANYHGPDSFTYHANDGDQNSNTVTVTINVVSVNDVPSALADPGYSTNEDTQLDGATVLINDSDEDLDALTAVLDDDVSNGTLSLNADGTFTYNPDANFNGIDTFTYHAYDSGADSNVVTVTIVVSSIPDLPVAVADTYTTNEDTPLTGNNVLANDSDGDGETLTAVLDTNVANGTLVLNTNGSFTYTPNANYNGSDSFTYHAQAGADNTAPVTVSITVNSVNDVPVAVANSYTTAEDTPLTGNNVLSNDTDVDGTLTAVLNTNVTRGTLVLNSNGTFTYTPNANIFGSDSFTYRASDGVATSNLVTVTITITAVNDVPVAVADSRSAVQDTTLTVAAPGVLSNDSDVETSSLTAVLNTTVSSGTLTLNPNGSFTYVPNTGFYGADSFTYRASDGTASSPAVTVTINVARTFWILGVVRIGNVTPLAGVTLTRTGGVSVQTDAGGNFTFKGLLPGSYTITPTLTNYFFSPTSAVVTISTGTKAVNFNASRNNQISGRISSTTGIGIANVSVSRGAVSVLTNSAGYYTFTQVTNGNYTITPTLSGNTFSPASRAVTVNNNDTVNLNFISGFTITGKVSTSAGVGLAGVTVKTNTNLSAVSNGAGFYVIHNVPSGAYTVSAVLAGSTFTPPNATVPVGSANVAGPNFIRVTGP